MPNINLLDGKDFSQEVEKFDEETVSYQDFQVEESEPEEVEKPVEQTVEEESPKESVQYEEPPPFRDRASNWPLIAGIAASFVIIILIIVFLLGRDEEKIAQQPEQSVTDSTEVVPTGEQQDSTEFAQQPDQEISEQRQQPTDERPPTEQPPPIETTVTASLSEARKTGVAGASLLGDFLSAFPSGMKMSFFRYGNNTYSAEVAASSTGVFDRFESNLKNQNASLQPQVLSEREIMVGGQVMKIRQINGSFPTTGSSLSPTKELASGRIRSEITAAARKFNLELRQLSVAPTFSSDAGQFQPSTLKAFGDQSNMIGFIQDLLKYRNVGINRLILSVLSQTDLTGTNIMATLDLDIYQ